jgi:hypothetical protein
VLGHRIVFEPFFLAETRDLTAADSLARIRDACFRRVPAPEPDWDQAREAS